jgi:hypothetical protein
LSASFWVYKSSVAALPFVGNRSMARRLHRNTGDTPPDAPMDIARYMKIINELERMKMQ